jgi:hypothetical protein
VRLLRVRVYILEKLSSFIHKLIGFNAYPTLQAYEKRLMSSEESQETCINSLLSNQEQDPLVITTNTNIKKLIYRSAESNCEYKRSCDLDHIVLHPSPDISNKWGTTIDTAKTQRKFHSKRPQTTRRYYKHISSSSDQSSRRRSRYPRIPVKPII